MLPIGVPVACIADLDIMPDCAPEILGLVDGDDDKKWQSSRRRWKALRDIGENAKTRESELLAVRKRLQGNDGQSVRTFVADHWTFEYDLAMSGLAEEVLVAACLAKNDDPLNAKKKKSRRGGWLMREKMFANLKTLSDGNRENLCARIYSLVSFRGCFEGGRSSVSRGNSYRVVSKER